MSEYGTTLVRASRPKIEWIDIACIDESAPVYLEKWRGEWVECWSDWEWEDGN